MRLILTLVAVGLLAACKAQQPAANQAQPANVAIAENAKIAAADPAAPLGAAVSGEQAKAVMHERHDGMEKIGKATKAIGRELKASSPDLAAIREAAKTLTSLASKSPGWFPPGTGPDVGKTGAKPEIWQSPADVATKSRDFAGAAQRFNTAAQSGDLTAIKGSFADLGKTCKACHDKYRKERHH